ncbi:type IV secretion system protein VirB2 [Luteibacter sp. Sphag1AF]|uniref:TrbC/VirB2 family protein n=1 Tax=Luteibacter sp. Sphag1AF TaxID=2587031 RepID=UPI00161392AB|nr:TrbC/VirB2 family protein [Luteibacter sp. Sphag1AF]MBB3227104.1 type IV secretion system protein VirB2 [Luteibacter sp. Sphag1AF]
MALPFLNDSNVSSQTSLSRKVAFFAMMVAIMLPGLVLADPEVGVGETSTKVCGFFQNINSLLNAASIVVVTIAVIFSGYQIAFAHKRIADVAPALIGGVLIGAAAQVATMVVGGSGGAAKACTSTSGATTMIFDHLHTAAQFLHLYA